MARTNRLKSAVCGMAIGMALAAGMSTVSALAQEPPPPPRDMKPHMPFDHDCTDAAAHEAAMLAFAQVKLKLTDAQAAAWSQFTDKVKAASAPVQQVCLQLKDKPEPKTLPERLAIMDQMMSAHAAELHQIRPAAETLYAQLTPEQKQIADHELMHGFGGPGGPPHDGPGEHGPHGGPGAPPPPGEHP